MNKSFVRCQRSWYQRSSVSIHLCACTSIVNKSVKFTLALNLFDDDGCYVKVIVCAVQEVLYDFMLVSVSICPCTCTSIVSQPN